MKKIGVALLGLGTVGGGTYRILMNHRNAIRKNDGVDIEIKHILEKDRAKAEALGVDMKIVSTDIDLVANDSSVNIVAEFFGGIEPARSFIIKCLKAGKSVVTANKELVSKYWPDLEQAAKEGKSGLYFEASCVGGVPIIRTLTEGMQGNNIQSLMGIVNGTTNYILTKMSDEGLDYNDVLKEAQKLGYAEANPTADVDGFDSMYKISILSSLAFHTKVPISKVYREGITNITKDDIAFGKEFGYTLKLLAIAKRENNLVEARVHPTFVKNDHPLASVKDSFNAVLLKGDNVGEVMLYGRGAGDLPTGSAIVSDIVFASKQTKHKYTTFKNSNDISDKFFTKNYQCNYYLRLEVADEVGVLSKITSVLAKHRASVKSIHQVQNLETNTAKVVIMLDKTQESNVIKALKVLENTDCVLKINSLIRVEE